MQSGMLVQPSGLLAPKAMFAPGRTRKAKPGNSTVVLSPVSLRLGAAKVYAPFVDVRGVSGLHVLRSNGSC